MSADNRPVILTFVPYYLPGYKSGGPIRSIANMVDRLSDRFDFRIVTSDRDATDPAPYDGVTSNTWARVGKAQVYYTSPAGRSFPALYRLLNEVSYDVLYLNSVFFYDFTLKPMLLRRLGLIPDRPVILASRGEFSEGALALKAAKKQSFLVLARAISFYGNLRWQATSRHEARDIQRQMGGDVEVSIASDLAPSYEVPDVTRSAKQPNTLRLLFLSRITPMKNLELALDILSNVEVPVSFTIVGPVRDEAYWSQCQDKIRALPPHIDVSYRGSVSHHQVLDIMADHDLFFLPTAGENYGHVIQEALSAGTPVLISDRTPWRDLEEEGVGWDLPLNQPARFQEVIESCAQKSPEAYEIWREQIAEWQLNLQTDDQSLARNSNMICLALEA